MIRKFVFLRRRKDMESAAFQSHWRGAHAERLSENPDLWKGVSRLVQNAVAPAVPDVTPDPIWDGLMQVEFGSERPSVEEARDDARNKSVGPGEAEFIDADQIVQFFAQEKVVVDGPERGVKILSLPRRRSWLSPAEFSQHYRNVHGELVRRNEAFATFANRYVQHHVLPDTVKSTGGFVPYDGISEFWFNSFEHAKSAWAAPSYMAELRADEKNFVGSPPSHRLVVQEHVVIRKIG